MSIFGRSSGSSSELPDRRIAKVDLGTFGLDTSKITTYYSKCTEFSIQEKCTWFVRRSQIDAGYPP